VPAAPVIVHVHMSTPLYVHAQVVPPHSASQTSPAVSLHVDEQVGIPTDPELAVPEHEPPPPEGRGMFGHTLLGTLLPAGAGFVIVVDTPPPSFRHAITACCCESHPWAYWAIPMLLAHVGCSPSMQRRNVVAAGAHDVDANCEQLIGQLVLSPAEHPACAILSQMTEHAAEI
jgi:hypothetical protein